MSLNTTLGLLKYMAADLDIKLEGLNHAGILLEPFLKEGRASIRVYNTEGIQAHYDVKDIENHLPLAPVDMQPVRFWVRTINAKMEATRVNERNNALCRAIEDIIRLKNDGAIQFHDEVEFQKLIAAYRAIEPDQPSYLIPSN